MLAGGARPSLTRCYGIVHPAVREIGELVGNQLGHGGRRLRPRCMSGGWIEGSRRRGPALACYFPAKPASGLVASEPNIQAISRDVQRFDHFRGGCYSNLPLQESTYCSRFFRALRRLLNSVAIRTHRAWVSSNNSRHGGVPVNGGSSVSVKAA